MHITSAAIRQAAQDKADQAAARMQKAQDAGSVQAAQPPHIQVQLDLGNDFALQGYGITTRLEGQLQVSNGPGSLVKSTPSTGATAPGGNRWMCKVAPCALTAAYANPAIDIVAVRPNIEVKAGVKVTGSANDPRVTLFSEPEMSDAEKLSWVVMGRSAAAGARGNRAAANKRHWRCSAGAGARATSPASWVLMKWASKAQRRWHTRGCGEP